MTDARRARHRGDPADRVGRPGVPPPRVRRGRGDRRRRAARARRRDARTRSCTWRRSRCRPASATSPAARSTGSARRRAHRAVRVRPGQCRRAVVPGRRASRGRSPPTTSAPAVLQRAIRGQAGVQRFFHESGRAFCLYVVLGAYSNRQQVVPEVNDGARDADRSTSSAAADTTTSTTTDAVDDHAPTAADDRRRRHRATTSPPATRGPARHDPERRRERARGSVRDRGGAARGRWCVQGRRARATPRRRSPRSGCGSPRSSPPGPRCASAARSRWSSVSARSLVGGPVFAALVAVSYLAFAGFVVVALRSGAPISSCGCFGKVDTPPSLVHVVIDLVLAAVAAVGRGRRWCRASRRARRSAVARDPVPVPPRDRMFARVPRVHRAPEDHGRGPGGRRVSTSPGESKGVAFTNWLVSQDAPGCSSGSRAGAGSSSVRRWSGPRSRSPGARRRPSRARPYNHITDCARWALHRRVHRVLLHDQQRHQRVPAGQLRRGLVARRLLELLQRHPLLHRLHAELLRAATSATGSARAAPSAAAPAAATRDGSTATTSATGSATRRSAITGPIACRVVTCTPPYADASTGVQHRGRGRQLHRRARARARLHTAPAAPAPVRHRGAVAHDRRGGGSRGGLGLGLRQELPTRASSTGSSPEARGARSRHSGRRSTPAWRPRSSDPISSCSGAGATTRYWVQRRSGGAWSGWRSMRGNFVSDPCAVSRRFDAEGLRPRRRQRGLGQHVERRGH